MALTQPLPAVDTVAALVGYNRLEPRPRTNEFNRSLRAEVRDATWLLARQWQLKEFRAEDRGVPAYAEITMETAPLTHVSRGDGAPRPYAGAPAPPATLGDPGAAAPTTPAPAATGFAGALPLDAIVEAQPVALTPGLRLELGATWVRQLRQGGLGQYVAAFRQHFPLAARAETGDYDLAFGLEQSLGEAQQVLALAATTGLDGYQLYAALVGDYRPVLAAAGVTEAGQPAAFTSLRQAAQQFVASVGRLYFGPFHNSPTFEADQPTGWVAPELTYQFAVAVPTTDAVAPLVLAAPTHAAHALEWYSLDERPAAGSFLNAAARAQRTTTRFTPTVLRFPGSPNSRWWEFEDRAVDFGTLSGDASDLGRMLLQEFMFLYQKDWFSLPYTVPVGSLSTVRHLTVRDVFGQTYAIRPAGASDLTEAGAGTPVDNDEGRWNLFGLSRQGTRQAAVPRILVPPAVVAPQVGKPLEQVLLRREEATNLVWAVEQTVPDGLGRGLDGTAAATRLTQYLKSRALPLPSLTEARFRYQPATSVAENWIPFLPRPDAQGTYRLLQGAMQRSLDGLPLAAADQTVQPRTPLLQLGDPAAEYVVHERQVPPTGVQLTGAFRRARWFNGQIALWYARERTAGTGASLGGSGLTFDELLPLAAPPIPAGPNAWYQAGLGVSYDAAGHLTRWRDLSGNGLDLEPINPSVYGHSTVSPDRLNGLPLVRTRALTSAQRNCRIAGNGGRTVYVLGKATVNPPSPNHAFASVFVSSGDVIGENHLFECAVSNGELLIHAYGTGNNSLGSLPAQPVLSPALLAWRYDGNGHSYCDFNDQRGVAAGPPAYDTVPSALALGWGWHYQSQPIDVLEVIVYDRFLTPAEDARVRAYLGQKGNVPV